MDLDFTFAALALSALVLVGIYFYIYTIDRGYDITDEAIFYLQLERPQDVRCYPLFDFCYFSAIFRWTKGSIVFHRWLLFAAYIIGTSFFCWGALALMYSWYPPLMQSWSFTVSFCALLFLSSHLRFSFANRILYYNHISSLSSMAAAGILLALTFSPAGISSNPYLLFFAGLLTGIQFFAKISCFLVHIPALILFLAISQFSTPQAGLTAALFLALGIATEMIFHFSLLQSPRAWWGAFSEQMKCAKHFSWGPSVVSRHSREVIELFRKVYTFNRIHLLGFAVFALACTSIEIDKTIVLSLLAIWLFDLHRGFYQSRVPHWEQRLFLQPAGVAYAQILVFAVLALGLSFLTFSSSAALEEVTVTLPHVAAWLYLCILPGVVAAGTSNPLYLNIVFTLAPWGVLLTTIYITLGLITGSPLFFTVFAPLGAGILLIHTLYLSLFKPYRVLGTLLDQKIPTEIGKTGTVLKLDPHTRSALLQIRALMEKNGFKTGDDIIALFDMPGLVHVLGGISPGHQWYYTGVDNDAMMRVNFDWLSKVPEKRRTGAYLATKGNIDFFNDHLKNLGIVLANDYIELGKTFWPQTEEIITIWKPVHQLAQNDEANVFVHVDRARAHLEKEELDAAVSELKAALKIKPGSAELALDLAGILLSLSRLEESEEYFRNVLKVIPEHSDALTGIATIMVQRGNLNQANLCIEQALTSNPANPLAQRLRTMVQGGANPPVHPGGA